MNVPNHEKKVFRDMTPDERGAIVEALLVNGVEAHDACAPGVWVDFQGALQTFLLHRGLQFGDFVLRTKQRQLVIPWEHIKPECKFAALQGTGEVWFYEIEPELRADERGAWWFGKGADCWESVLVIDTSGIDPERSLTARPEGV